MRRLLSIGSVLIGLPLWVAVLPFWLPMSLLIDGVTRLWRFPSVRLATFLGVYLVHSWIAIFVAFGLWVSGRFGANPKLEAHRAMQAWWARSLLAWAGRLLGVRVEWPDTADLPTGPFIVLSRHASMVDAILPAVLVASKLGRFVHYVLKAELRWDPSLDLYGTRLGNHFVTRSGGQTETEPAAIADLARRAQPDAALIIFPEGTYATRSTRARIRASLERAASRPEAAAEDRLVFELADGLDHLLPPKPAGTLALLEGAPTADVVILGHVGLEGVANLRGLRRRLPLTEPIEMRWWVHPRPGIPGRADQQVAWLNRQWADLDRWVGTQRARRNPE